MPRFVIQQHYCEQQVHWDLMLEHEETLATWQVPAPPSDWPLIKLICRHIFNHRLIYLTYQGPLSDNRGEVQIEAAGTYESIEITENCWRVALNGDKIKGQLELQHLQQDQWQLHFTEECL